MKNILAEVNKIADLYQAGCLAFFGSWFGGIADAHLNIPAGELIN